MNIKQDARKLSLMGKDDLRRRVVQAVLAQGMSKLAAARVFGVSRTSVHSWVALHARGGADALTPWRSTCSTR